MVRGLTRQTTPRSSKWQAGPIDQEFARHRGLSIRQLSLIFDLLELNGTEVRKQPLIDRKESPRGFPKAKDGIEFNDHIEGVAGSPFGALDFNVASWGLMNPGMAEIRFGNNATHKKAAAPGGQRRAFYSIPANPEQSGDVIVLANHLIPMRQVKGAMMMRPGIPSAAPRGITHGRSYGAAAIASLPQSSRSAAAFPASVTSYTTSLILTETSVSQPNATRR